MAEVTFLGNHGLASLGGRAASQQPPAGFGYLVARGNAGAVGVAHSSGLQMIIGRVNIGVFMQSDVPVTVQFTLSPDPTAADAVWGSQITVSPSDIQKVNLAFTGIKVTFGTSGGSLFIGAL